MELSSHKADKDLSISTALFDNRLDESEIHDQVKTFTVHHGVQRRVQKVSQFGEFEQESAKEVYYQAFGPNDNYLASGYGDGGIRIYNIQTGKKAFHMQ